MNPSSSTDGAASGIAYAWGEGSNGQLGDGTPIPANPQHQELRPISVMTGVTSLDAGQQHAVAVKADGSVWTWGTLTVPWPGSGSQSNPLPVLVPGVSSRVAVAGGSSFTIALGEDRTGLAWGVNLYGQLGRGTNTSVEWAPGSVSGLSEAVAVSSGFSHTLALRSDGSIVAWG